MDALFDAVCGPSPSGCDTVGIWVGALLTLLVFSYLLHDTFLFRLAQSVLVGAAIGYGSAVILRTVLWDRLLVPLSTNFAVFWPLAFSLVLGLLLLLKLVPRWSSSALGNLPLGYLFGVGAALAIGGAINSTIGQQAPATIVALWPIRDVGAWVSSIVILIGVLGALLAFRFARPEGGGVVRVYARVAGAWGQAGRGFIMIAFGALFANILSARISVLVGQLYFLMHDWLGVIK